MSVSIDSSNITHSASINFEINMKVYFSHGKESGPRGTKIKRLAAMAEEIDLYERQMELRKQAKIDEKVFAELRLRRGAYGQRYDNGQRYDGTETREIPFPRKGLTKGIFPPRKCRDRQK